jgi:uncharacterized protein
VDELFDRLAKLESAPRDAAAERLIAEGLQRAPHAVYALVQTALLQDEALKRANARIEELQARAEGAGTDEPEQRPASFLDTMRQALGGAPTRGSVPRVRAAAPGGGPQDSQANLQPQGQPQPGYPPQTPPGYPSNAPFGGGGSFLGTAASAAAGVVGGALLLDGIRSMFGHHLGGYGSSAFGDFAGDRATPWGGSTSGSAADSQLARDAGIDHVGDHVRGDADHASQAADDSLQTADDENIADDSDFGDGDDSDFDGGDGGDSYDA